MADKKRPYEYNGIEFVPPGDNEFNPLTAKKIYESIVEEEELVQKLEERKRRKIADIDDQISASQNTIAEQTGYLSNNFISVDFNGTNFILPKTEKVIDILRTIPKTFRRFSVREMLLVEIQKFATADTFTPVHYLFYRVSRFEEYVKRILSKKK